MCSSDLTGALKQWIVISWTYDNLIAYSTSISSLLLFDITNLCYRYSNDHNISIRPFQVNSRLCRIKEDLGVVTYIFAAFSWIGCLEAEIHSLSHLPIEPSGRRHNQTYFFNFGTGVYLDPCTKLGVPMDVIFAFEMYIKWHIMAYKWYHASRSFHHHKIHPFFALFDRLRPRFAYFRIPRQHICMQHNRSLFL